MASTSSTFSGPFTRAMGLTSGLTDWTLRGPGFRRVVTNVYVPAAVRLTPAVRARAVLLIAPKGAVVARHTAAQIWGGVVPDSPDIHLLVPRGSRFRREGVLATETEDVSAVVRAGVSLTSPARTFVDLARTLTLVELVVLGDSRVRRGAVNRDQLVADAAVARGRGARLARRAATYVRDGVDSPMETRLRMLIVLGGLPEPVVNYMLRDEHGAWLMRFDLSYPAWRIAVEYDGRQHAESSRQWVHDVGRREWLDTNGWRLVVVLSGDLFGKAGATLARVECVLAERGALTGLTKRSACRCDEWQRYFRHDG
ncbi:MAG: hypothetical protein M3Y06_01325 [Actinomycetota bacterium]|nr:hypothetical protein [Actinomycetota bacterium]